MPTESDETLQSWFISRMQAAGYNTSLTGCCFGIANMAKQAFLVGELDKFYARLERLSKTPLEHFANDFSILRETADQLHSDDKTHNKAKTIIDEIVDFKAFFEGLALYQSPSAYPDVIPNLQQKQNATRSLELTQSIAMESLGKVTIDHLNCLFTERSLPDFFKIVQANLSNYSFSTIWGDDRHAVNISYDTTSKEWIWIDANRLLDDNEQIVKYTFTDPEAIAQALSGFFKERLCVNINVQIFANQKNADAMQPTYAALRNTLAYQRSYCQEALDYLFNFDQLPEQTGYEILWNLGNRFRSKIISIDEYLDTLDILFAKTSPSEILEFVCLHKPPNAKSWVSYLIENHRAIPNITAMSCAEPEVLDAILTAVSKLELEQQEAIFTQTNNEGDNILMRIIPSVETAEKIIHRLNHFSDAFWEKMLTQTNTSGSNVLRLSASFCPEYFPLLMSKVAKLPYETQKKILEPTVKNLKLCIKNEKDPECKAAYQARYTMLFNQLKKARKQTKVSVLQQTMKLFRANTDIQTNQSKDLSATRPNNSPKSK